MFLTGQSKHSCVEVEDNRPGDGEALSDRSLTLVMKGAHLINETTARDMLLRIAEDSRLGACPSNRF